MTIQRSWSFPFFAKFEREIQFSAYTQAVFLALAPRPLFNLDYVRLIMLAMAAYWMALLTIMLRRNGSATKNDRHFLQFGFLITMLLTFAIAKIIRAPI